MSLIDLKNISLKYAQTQLFSDISLTLESKNLISLIGPNGSGKSTLLRIIAGLLKPDHGKVWVQGQNVESYNRKDLARVRAFLPQQPILPEGMTVEQLVHCGRFAYQGMFSGPSKEDREVVAWAMAVCGVASFADKLLDALSGGEQQRVWLASALAQKAPILLLDEPSSFLDISYQLDLMGLLRKLVDDEGITVIMSSHDINHTSQYSDTVIALKQGKLSAFGTTADQLNSDLVGKIFNVTSEFVQSPLSGKPFCLAHTSNWTTD
ncbi:ABC transporter ATP-binding protein [Kiloniella litopenaei]|uniref:ABC transporter ATP-binding protein n=1 Tax=Kiloniella litopenaei TaxID=1549748 RepID=UPI003BAA580B